MAFRTGVNLDRSVLMVAVRTSSRHGNMLRMVEPHRFVDLGQAPENEDLRNIPHRVVSLEAETPIQRAMATRMIVDFFTVPVSIQVDTGWIPFMRMEMIGGPFAEIALAPLGLRHSPSVSRCVFANSTHSAPPRARAIPSTGRPPSWRTGPRLSPWSGWSLSRAFSIQALASFPERRFRVFVPTLADFTFNSHPFPYGSWRRISGTAELAVYLDNLAGDRRQHRIRSESTTRLHPFSPAPAGILRGQFDGIHLPDELPGEVIQPDDADGARLWTEPAVSLVVEEPLGDPEPGHARRFDPRGRRPSRGWYM